MADPRESKIVSVLLSSKASACDPCSSCKARRSVWPTMVWHEGSVRTACELGGEGGLSQPDSWGIASLRLKNRTMQDVHTDNELADSR